MGTVAEDKEDKDGEHAASENSGLSDIMEVAASLGIENDEGAEAEDDDDDAPDDDELAAAALVNDAADAPERGAAAANALEVAKAAEAKAEPKIEAPKVETPSEESPKLAVPKLEVPVKAEAPKPTKADDEERAAEAAAAAALASSRPSSAPVRVSAPVAAAAEPEKKNNNGMWIAAAAIALIGVAWFAMRDDGSKANANAEVRSAASAPERKVEAPPPKVEPTPPPAKVEAPPPEPEPEPVVEAPPEPVVEEKAEVTVKKGRGPKKTGADEPAAVKEPPGSKAPPGGPAEDPFASPKEIEERHRKECVLDPSKPGCGEILRKSHAAADLDASLADKLTQQQIRSGFASVKGKAKACGTQFGVEPGTTVRVKVSIAGDTGEVTSAEALSPHDSLPVGQCVADALKGATFQRFGSAQQGTTYPVQF